MVLVRGHDALKEVPATGIAVVSGGAETNGALLVHWIVTRARSGTFEFRA
jgi:hypothetical protein